MGRAILRVIVYGSASILVVGSFLLSYFLRETKQWVDLYANHATIIGLMLGVAGFALTIWTLFDGLRTNREAQERVQREVDQYRATLDRVLSDIRSHTFRDACDQAYSCSEQARHAIRTDLKLRALERTEEARKFVLRVLDFSDLTGPERTALRAIVEDLKTTIQFIETRIRKPDVLKIPADKLKPLDLLRDELDRIRSRLTTRLMGAENAT